MSAPTNRWKLGLFVLGTAILGLGGALFLGARALQRETVSYKSYFDEGVSGLENGAPVTFRGVKIGNVSGIDIAPDRRRVEITYDLGVTVLQRLGLASGKGRAIQISVPPDLRVQLGSSGLTGSKYLQIDFFDVKALPPPELPFPVPANHIPTAPSTMDSVMRAMDQIPVVLEGLSDILKQVNELIGDVREREIPDKAVATIGHVDRILVVLEHKLRQLDVDGLSGDARALAENVGATVTALNQILARVDGARGLMSKVEHATDSIGDVANGARDLGPQVGDALGELRETGIALRMLAEALERDPDMLIKGRARVRR